MFPLLCSVYLGTQRWQILLINPIAVKNKKEKLVSEKASLKKEKVLFFTDHLKHSEDQHDFNDHSDMILCSD